MNLFTFRAHRKVLGVLVTDSMSSDSGSAFPVGALIVEVTPGGAADKIGLLAGDVVIRLNDKLVTKSSELTSAVRQERKGTLVEIEILRDGNKLVFDVVL